jgi:anti-sigma-K factor RskA
MQVFLGFLIFIFLPLMICFLVWRASRSDELKRAGALDSPSALWRSAIGGNVLAVLIIAAIAVSVIVLILAKFYTGGIDGR